MSDFAHKLRSKNLACFGTPYESLETEQDPTLRRKGTSIEDQVVTDEKGRRRFHGAFTGGFSAGYFNTVGTEEGWTPATFKSSRKERAERKEQDISDFLDSEDTGEFGILPQGIQPKADFTPDEQNRKRARDEHSEHDPLADLLRPVRDSIGMELLRNMGWRPGHGIGPRLSRHQKVKELSKDPGEEWQKVYGCALPPKEFEAEFEEMAPEYHFAPEDLEVPEFEPKDNLHGLGYAGLTSGDVLNEEKNLIETALMPTPSPFFKEGPSRAKPVKSKGIRGQAFGVGAFEDEDTDVYSVEDVSKYDFSLGAGGFGRHPPQPGAHGARTETPGEFRNMFVQPSKPHRLLRKVFPPPVLPKDYKPKRVNEDPKIIAAAIAKKLTQQQHGVEERKGNLNPIQRGHMLGEEHSVMSLVKSSDRDMLAKRAAEQKEPKPERVSPQPGKTKLEPKQFQANRFRKDPGKQARFEDYRRYLSRGIPYPAPLDLTDWEWEAEKAEFDAELPADLQPAAESLDRRAGPMIGKARPDLVQSFTTRMKAKFVSGGAEEVLVKPSEIKFHADTDRIKAVEMKMFGPLTRQSWDWHPDRLLCRRFNVPDPFPDSSLVGTPSLRSTIAEPPMGDFGCLMTTQVEKSRPSELPRPDPIHPIPIVHKAADSPKPPAPSHETAVSAIEPTKFVPDPGQLEFDKEPRGPEPSVTSEALLMSTEPKFKERPPDELFQSIFGESSDSSSESEPEPQDLEPDVDILAKEPEKLPEVIHLEVTESKSGSRWNSASTSCAEQPPQIEELGNRTPDTPELNEPANDMREEGGFEDISGDLEALFYGPSVPPSDKTWEDSVKKFVSGEKKKRSHSKHKKKEKRKDRKISKKEKKKHKRKPSPF